MGCETKSVVVVLKKILSGVVVCVVVAVESVSSEKERAGGVSVSAGTRAKEQEDSWECFLSVLKSLETSLFFFFFHSRLTEALTE